MKTIILNKLMHSSRNIALALTVITTLTTGLWTTNAVAVEKTYHTDTGVSGNWVCGALANNTIGILTDEPSYNCASDSLVFPQSGSSRAFFEMQTVYSQDTLVTANDITFWLDDSDLSSPLDVSIGFVLEFYNASLDVWTRFGGTVNSNGTASIGAKTATFPDATPVNIPTGGKLRLGIYLNNSYIADVGSFVRFGTSTDAAGSIRLSVNEVDAALCALPVTNLSASDMTATSTTLTWTASSPSSDEYNVYRNGTLIGTVTEQSFTDNSVQPNTSYNYVVKNSNTALACEGPDVWLSIYASYDFGEILVNKSDEQTFVITNETANAISMSSSSNVTLSGTWASQYSITSNSCFSAGVLAPGVSCSIEATFTPTSEGVKDANIVVEFDGAVATVVIPLKGGLRSYLVKDANSGAASANPNKLTDVNGIVFYVSSDGVKGTELWKTDGTVDGTVMVKDINVGSGSSAPDNLININGTLFFTADNGVNGIELWKSDSTETVMVKDINPSGVTSLALLTNVNGTLFFTANDGVNGKELWKSNGTEAGTVMVKNMSLFGSTNFGHTSVISPMVNVNGTLFFRAKVSTAGTSNVSFGTQLYKSDGTEEGTVLVKNISFFSAPSDLFNMNGMLYFAASDDSNGRELWKSDGTADGTVLVSNIRDGSSSSSPGWFTDINGTLFFTANGADGLDGIELWKSDGTDAGTVMVKDIYDGGISSSALYLTNANGTLFFRATDGVNGIELWQSDGTDVGTVMVKDISAGNSSPNYLVNVNGTLFFSASDGINGNELWQSDGTPEGTFSVMDIYPGITSSSPLYLTASAGSLYFNASNGVVGRELWRFSPTQTPPTISPIADQETYDNHTLEIIFSISDQQSLLNCSEVVATSSEPSLLTSPITVPGSTSQECMISLTPVFNMTGTSIVTLTLSDDVQTTSTSFTVSWYDAIVVGKTLGNGVEHTSISSAISSVTTVNGNTVVVIDGTYTGADNRDIDFGNKNIILKSANGPQSTTIDCKYSGRAFLFQTGNTSVLEGFTLQNCEVLSDNDGGGAILIKNASPSIIDNRFMRNYAGDNNDGGAISVLGNSSPLIKGSRFWGNSAGSRESRQTRGGAISVNTSGVVNLENCEFEANTATAGGAISKFSGTIIIDKSRFRFNRASMGGAINGTALNITRSSFIGNIARDSGGAIVSVGAQISNSTFVKNQAEYSGGAITSTSGDYQITNSSFYDNAVKDPLSGGAISSAVLGSKSITNSIFWKNTAGQLSNQLHFDNSAGLETQTIDLDIENSILQGGISNISLLNEQYRGTALVVTGQNVLDSDPLFALDGNLRVMPDSPAIDAGTNNPSSGVLSTTDYEGVSRSLDGNNDSQSTADIGAFEYDPANQDNIAINSIDYRANATINDSPPEPLVLTLRNIGGGTTQWTVRTNATWLRVDTESGTAVDSLQSIPLYIDQAGLDHGVYEGTVDIIDSASGLLHRLTVTLNINQALRVPAEHATIQQAIDAAIDGDTVLVAGGMYTEELNKNIDLRGKAITVKSEDGPEATIINANGVGRGFLLERGEDRSTVIEGFTIRESALRGAIYTAEGVSGSFLSIHFKANTNGGMYAAGAVSIRNSEFVDNGSSIGGAGLYLDSTSGAEVVNSKFIGNETALGKFGGGIYDHSSRDLRITNSEFRSNKANQGGGIYSSGAVADLDNIKLRPKLFLNNVFTQNVIETGLAGGAGGAIYSAKDHNLTIANSLFYNNDGGIYSAESNNTQLINSTLYDSEIQVYWRYEYNSFSVTNSILSSLISHFHRPVNPFGEIFSTTNSANVTVSHSTISSGWSGGTAVDNIDPMFRVIDFGADGIVGPDANGIDDDTYDFRLDPASPMIDSGLTLSSLFSDIRGSVRPVDGNVDTNEPGAQFDRGAYEYSEYYGGIAGDEIAKSLKNLRINGAQQVVGFEYVIQWDDKDPFPAGDPRVSQAGEYDVNLALVSDEGLRIELDTFTVTISAAGYNKFFNFAPEHIGDWKLRLELASDPNQFVLSDNVFIRYKEVTKYDLGKEIIAPAAADRNQKPDVGDETIVYWSAETNRLYAIGPGTTVVTWYEDEQHKNPIPVVAQFVYPSSPQRHIAGAQAVTLLPAGSRFNSVQAKYKDNDAVIAGNSFTASVEGWAVLLFRDGDHQNVDKREVFEVVRTYNWNHNKPEKPKEPVFPIEDKDTAVIGKAIIDAGHDASCGNGYVFFEEGFYDGRGVNKAYDRETREGPIFPINRDLTGNITSLQDPQDDLVVVWYTKSLESDVCWPDKPVRYDAKWPTDPKDFETIVIASQLGSGPLDPAIYGQLSNMVIYNQPDRKVLGYNPNEEHAAFFTAQGSTSPGIFPLRSDLNRTDTSESYSLLKYRDPLTNEWNIEVFKVVANSDRYRLDVESIVAADLNDDRYCLNSNGKVTPQISCVAEASYYLDEAGNLVNPADKAICYQPESVGGAIREAACPSTNRYSLNGNGELQVSPTTPTSVEYSLDQYNVLVENDIYYRFHYNSTAGNEINPPYPLNQLTFGPCTESFISSGSEQYMLRDKDEKMFAYQGDVDVKLEYFYKLQAGFFYDLNSDGNPNKTVGSCVAWLEGLDEMSNGVNPIFDGVNPVETTYAISWPAQVPSLFVGETLVDAKTQTGEPVGLPNIGDQCQVDVLYDAPIVNADMDYSKYSVNLIDPLTEYSSVLYVLGDLPQTLKPKKDLATGRWIFTALPYHLQNRLTYDEVDQQLKLKGSYAAGVGEPFLLMNILSARDLAIINTTLTIPVLDGKKDIFNAMVLGVNILAIDARDLAANNSKYASLKDAELKALTAGDVHGTGYVTLAFNNHADCPAPTVLSVISVGGPLYEGDIKVIESPNPFEEKVTLKHNGDFGGNADTRAFQWMYTPADFSGVPCRPAAHESDPESCVTRTWLPYEPLPNVLSPTSPNTVIPDGESLPFYVGAADAVIQGTGQQLLPDKWFAVRYNFDNPENTVDGKWPVSQLNNPGVDSDPISAWTAPQLYEGWIKRVMKKINLFDQKIKDFHATSANTTADLISLAGQRYEGPVALSDDPAYLQGLGIIEVYETLLARGHSLTSENGDFDDINKSLLFASNRLADLYMLLGNEAYADAADPTIGFSADGGVYGSEASSIYSFQNQTDSLLEEELDLLRGVDNAGIRPFYNHLLWNFTLGDGEVAYKENYNIQDANSDGEINEQDALIQFPQGHGDAWGHYLSASKKYYDLLKSDNFTWRPQTENILVAGTPVEVDYRDERKFAKVAAAKAKSGAEIVNLTYRDHYTADPEGQWQGYKDIDPDRAWGVDGWSRRAGQGAFFDWVTGNAMLPAVADLAERSHTVIVAAGEMTYILPYYESDPANPSLTLAVTRYNSETGIDDPLNYNLPIVFNADNRPVVTITSSLNKDDAVKFVWNVPADSIQKIDRSTVVELWEVVGSYQSIEAEIDKADAGLNPLGLVSDVVPFDIDPARIAAGETHFEQIYGRAVQAMNNAIAVFNHANESSQLMRRQQDTLVDFKRNVENSEADYNNRLIEVFGYPYADDCGPGKTYDTDYCNNEPDLYHYMYVDASKLMGIEAPQVHEFDVLMKTYRDVTANGVPLADEKLVTFHIATDSRFGIIKPPSWNSSRKAPGEIQLARSDLLQLRGRFDKVIGEYGDLIFNIELQTKLIKDQYALNAEEIRIMTNGKYEQQTLNTSIKSAREFQLDARKTAQYLRFGAKAGAAGIPTSVGFSNDLGGPFRTAILTVAKVAAEIYDLKADDSIVSELGHQQAKEIASAETSIELATDRGDFAIKQQLLQIENLVRNEATMRLEMYTLAEGLKQSANRYLGVLAKGDRLLRDRLRIRTQTAAQIQDYRYKDMTFRIFRNDALQKYRAQFDMASMYVYLAAKTYDYETTLLDSSSLAGQHFLTSIVKQRSIGQIENGQPLTGSGLADPMKRLWQNFQVLKPQLGFNNPQQETNRFSLRKEMMRITLDSGSNATWRQALEANRVDNLWDNEDFRRYMRPFGAEGVPEPGIIIPFSTTVTSGLNFFRWPLGGGDSYYSPSNFATKISSVGVWFSNYNAVGLAQTPRIYLVPVGEDRLRTPSYDVNDIRTWNVVDQKLPTPFPIVDTEMKNNAGWIPTVDTLFDEMFQIRRHSNFRAYHDSGFINQSELQYDSRLIGRSVWNTRWLLVIPGRSLLYDAEEGLETFINGPESLFGDTRTGNGISDIKLFFETYSYSGN